MESHHTQCICALCFTTRYLDTIATSPSPPESANPPPLSEPAIHTGRVTAPRGERVPITRRQSFPPSTESVHSRRPICPFSPNSWVRPPVYLRYPLPPLPLPAPQRDSDLEGNRQPTSTIAAVHTYSMAQFFADSERIASNRMDIRRPRRDSTPPIPPPSETVVIQEPLPQLEPQETITYIRKCGVCQETGVGQRAVFSACGHCTCYQCARDISLAAAAANKYITCPYCRVSSNVKKLFED